MSVVANTVVSVKAAIAADSGVGGLSNSTSAAYVRFVGEARDPEYGLDRSMNYPYILIDVVDDPYHSFELAESSDAYPGQGSRVTVRLNIYTDRDQGSANMNSVMARVRRVFSNFTLAPSGGWSYSRCMNHREGFPPAGDKVARSVCEFVAAANRS